MTHALVNIIKCIQFIALCLVVCNGYSQQQAIDSIYLAANNELKEDSVFQILSTGLLMAMREDATQCEPFVERLLELEFVQSDSARLMRVHKRNAICQRKIGNYVRSIQQHKECYQYYRYHNDTIPWAQCADQIGTMSSYVGNVSAAQQYLHEVYDLYSKAGTVRNVAGACNGLAILYDELSQPEKAEQWYLRALEKYQEANDSIGLSSVNANLGLLYTGTKEYDQAEYHIRAQGRIDSLIGDQDGIGYYFDIMGYLRTQQGRYPEALDALQQSLNIRQSLASHYNVAETRVSLAQTYLSLKRYDDVIAQCKLILLHKDDHQSLHLERTSLQFLSNAYEQKGDSKKALSYFKQMTKVKDSIFSITHLEEITEKEAKFEKAQDEAKIQLLNAEKIATERIVQQKNTTIYLSCLALALVSFLSFFLYRMFNKVKRQRELIKKALDEKDLLLREIHHRVKNNLQIVSSLLTLQGQSIQDEKAIEAIKQGKTRVRSMALIHKNLYGRENLLGIGVKEYIENLCTELFSTYRIDEDRIELQLDIDDVELEVDTLVPLGLILNELITNVLKYAFPDERKGTLSIYLKEVKDTLELSVQDNGVGYDPKQVDDTSFGSTLVSALSQQLNSEIETRSSSDGTTSRLVIDKE